MAQNARYDSNFIQYAGKIFFTSAALTYEDQDEMKSFSRVLDMQCV